jgi:prolyl-tRNA synthetase
MKTMAMMVVEKDRKTGKETARPVVVLLRGDHQLNEAKLSSALGKEARPMQEEEIHQVFRSPAGFLGPIGLTNVAVAKDGSFGEGTIVFVDKALESRTNLIAGANKEDYHLKNVTPGRDFLPTAYVDVRTVTAGEACPNCGGRLRIDTAVEIGHIFKLGYKYTESMGARVLDRNGKEVTPIMGSYGIGIERILTASVEQNNDENGFWLPPQIAPFEIIVTPTNAADDKLMNTALEIVRNLESAGFDVLLDDRDERPGVKFKDADLVGIPYRVTVGKKVTEGTVEVVRRSTREVADVSIAAITEHFKKLLGPAR